MSDQVSLFGNDEVSGALFDPTRAYRYRLWRRWSTGSPLLWIMLNPSTADENVLDPTLRRVAGFTKSLGYGAFEVGNVYGLRSTDPAGLWAVEDPVGPENLRVLEEAIREAADVVVGWGIHAREADVANLMAIFDRTGIQPKSLATNTDGSPGHPLYLPKTATLEPWPEM